VLDHLAGPDYVERVVIERQRPVDRNETEIERRVAGPRPLERRLCDVDADRLGARLRECGGEVAGAAAEVKRAVAGAYLVAQEPEPAFELRRLELVRQPLPKILVVVPDGATVSPALPLDGPGRVGISRHFRPRTG
jgi:hypothetical protein